MQDRFADRSEWFDEHYATTRRRVRLALVLERLRRRLPPPPARILDAGGGTGAFAVPLASRGDEVTLLDASEEWLDRARMNAKAAGVEFRTIRGEVEDAANLLEPGFDVALCHAVLMYTEDPKVGLRQLRSLVRDDGQLSLLEKNQDAISLRPGLQGDYREARRLLHERQSKGRLGIENQAHRIEEWETMLEQTGWTLVDWVGVRLFSDAAPESLSDDEFDALLALERDAGTMGSYRRVSRLVHMWARATASRPHSAAVPGDAHRYAEDVARILFDVLDSQLIGVYLHGSLAMGGFVPSRSDVDVLAVCREAASDYVKARVSEALSEDRLPCPGVGLELSLVSVDDLRDVTGTPAFQLHIDTAEGRVVDGALHPGDEDLVMHYAVCRARGETLFGRPPEHVLPEVPRSDVLQALAKELVWGLEHESTGYAVLNACRAWRYLVDGIFTSKVEGGTWALSRVGDRSLVETALDRQAGAAVVPDEAATRGFVEDIRRLLEDASDI